MTLDPREMSMRAYYSMVARAETLQTQIIMAKMKVQHFGAEAIPMHHNIEMLETAPEKMARQIERDSAELGGLIANIREMEPYFKRDREAWAEGVAESLGIKRGKATGAKKPR